MVQYWTNWNKLGQGVTASSRRQRMVFLTSVSKHHLALIAPKEGRGEGNTLLEREQARGSLFSATDCYNLILDRLEVRRKVAQKAALIRGVGDPHTLSVARVNLLEKLADTQTPPICRAEDLLRSMEKKQEDLSQQVRSLQTSVTNNNRANRNNTNRKSYYGNNNKNSSSYTNKKGNPNNNGSNNNNYNNNNYISNKNNDPNLNQHDPPTPNYNPN